MSKAKIYHVLCKHLQSDARWLWSWSSGWFATDDLGWMFLIDSMQRWRLYLLHLRWSSRGWTTSREAYNDIMENQYVSLFWPTKDLKTCHDLLFFATIEWGRDEINFKNCENLVGLEGWGQHNGLPISAVLYSLFSQSPSVFRAWGILKTDFRAHWRFTTSVSKDAATCNGHGRCTDAKSLNSTKFFKSETTWNDLTAKFEPFPGWPLSMWPWLVWWAGRHRSTKPFKETGKLHRIIRIWRGHQKVGTNEAVRYCFQRSNMQKKLCLWQSASCL